MKLRVGDEVIVLSGRDKDKKGKVERLLPKEDKIVVAGINMYKRSLRGENRVKQSGIIDIVKPIAAAKVSFVCPKCKLPARVGYILKNNEKSRFCKKCEQIIS